MGGISERLKELAVAADEGIGSLKKFPESAKVGEGGKLPRAQELHMPGIDTVVGSTDFTERFTPNYFRKDTIVVGICLSISLIGLLVSIISKYISRQIIQRIPQSNILTLPTIYQEDLFQITTSHSKARIVQVQSIYKNDTGDLFL